MYIKSLWWLVTVPNMNKIHWLISDIAVKMYKNYDIVDRNATSWHRAMVYFTCIKSLLWLINVPNMNKINHYFLRYRNNHHILLYRKCAKIDIITQIWHRAKFHFMCISGPCSLIMVPNIKKIHLAIMEEWREDGQTDWIPLSSCYTNFKCRCLLDSLPKQQASLLISRYIFLSITVWETQGC